VLVQENVLNRLDARTGDGRPVIAGAIVTDEYGTPSKDFYLNDDAIIVYHAAAAHTDGDSLVHFRHADVLATGDVFTPGQFPRIDVTRGGSVQGELAALNLLLHIAVPKAFEEGGTYVIPGRGRICDEADLVQYRDMVRVVTDRVQAMLTRHRSLTEVLAAHPAFDYQTEYAHGGPSPDEFVTAVYRSLAHPPAALMQALAADLASRYGMSVEVSVKGGTKP
jgi:glyoxylase-like metal-dependent hydrolase (beta-lactamase superfamily II)